MEAFSFLKHWRSSGGGSGVIATTTTTVLCTGDAIVNAHASPATIVAADADSLYSSDVEDGPYFDMEFALPDQESDADEEPPERSPDNLSQSPHETENEDENESDSGDISVHETRGEDEDGELEFTFASSECTDQTVPAISPSDELYLNSNFVPIGHSDSLFNGSTEENLKLPVFLVKSATKFRVLLLKLKKSKSSNGGYLGKLEKSEKDEAGNGKKDENQGKMSGKFMAVKIKVEEGPLLYLFTRDNGNGHRKVLKINAEDNISESSDETKFTKDMLLQKYLKMVKPFYVHVSKRYVEKLRFSGALGGTPKGSPPPCPAEKMVGEVAAEERGNVKTHLKQGNNNNLQAGLKLVRKHLGKSRSACAAVVEAPAGKTAPNRRDDSLAQQQDGIQGAILHCKRSFNALRDVEASSTLCRSSSDPSHEKSMMMPKAS